ncbi:MAG: rhodanese-like domain-containing protein [Hyphomicrobiaceae bacterium]
MAKTITAHDLKKALSAPGEIALLDVRETGEYSQGHPFHVTPLSYSRLELNVERLLPRKTVKVVVVDGGNGLAQTAARRLETLGYKDVEVLEGGAPGWKAAGYHLYEGVNVPSKTFGEVVEIERHTPRIKAKDLVAMLERGDNHVIVDGRSWEEYTTFYIPGGMSCPNGELVLHIDVIAPDPKTKIVVNCAGRTRSIIGAQTLIDWGVPNEVVALENGTQGYWLEGIPIEHGADRRAPQAARTPESLAAKREKARAHADRHGVRFAKADEVIALASDPGRTTFLLDVRTPEEIKRDILPAFSHAPGGQLQQATDQWVGVKGAQVVLSDLGEMVRAPMVGAWLRQLGHDVIVLTDGEDARAKLEASSLAAKRKATFDASRIRQKETSPADAKAMLDSGSGQLIDIRPSMSYRDEAIPGSTWTLRSKIGSALADPSKPVVLVAASPELAALAALDLTEAGVGHVSVLTGGMEGWKAAGNPVAPSPDTPSDAECVDFVFHTLGRNEGNLDAARAYLAWETDLVNQMDEAERASFRL